MSPLHRSLPTVLAAATLFCTIGGAHAQTRVASPAPAKPAKTTAAASTSEKEPDSFLYVPGAYQDWKPASAPQIAAVAGSTTRFEGYINLAGTGEQSFKFTAVPNWDGTNYGNGGGGTFSTDGQAGGLTVSAGGYYELTADLSKNTWTATKIAWSVIGNATPGGWEKDSPMTYDPEKQIWTVTLAMKADGSFKFRANNAWKIDFGLDGNGKLQYVDNPFFDYNPSLKDLTVPDDGTYTLTLDLHTPGHYKYSIQATK